MSAPPRVVRLRGAVCGACGYHMDGLEAVGGVAHCPECGGAAMVDMPPVSGPGRSSGREFSVRRVLIWSLWLAVVLIIVGVLVVR
ncbi:MAG: hypothetical protein RBS39_07810 [Phycisphaerales bacterium]|nr:hypothetical protein [Phycisphaerales bacterium]